MPSQSNQPKKSRPTLPTPPATPRPRLERRIVPLQPLVEADGVTLTRAGRLLLQEVEAEMASETPGNLVRWLALLAQVRREDQTPDGDAA